MDTPASAVIGTPISTLPQAALPLTGAETLPMVQDGITTRALVSDIAGSAMGGSVFFGGVVSPAALPAGQTDNWAVDLTDISRIRADASGDATLTGLAGGADGRYIILTNVSDFNITLLNESSSTSTNRFAINGDPIIPPNCSVAMIYDSSIGRWSVLGV